MGGIVAIVGGGPGIIAGASGVVALPMAKLYAAHGPSMLTLLLCAVVTVIVIIVIIVLFIFVSYIFDISCLLSQAVFCYEMNVLVCSLKIRSCKHWQLYV